MNFRTELTYYKNKIQRNLAWRDVDEITPDIVELLALTEGVVQKLQAKELEAERTKE